MEYCDELLKLRKLEKEYKELKKKVEQDHILTIIYNEATKERMCNRTIHEYVCKINDYIRMHIPENPTTADIERLRLSYVSKYKLKIVEVEPDLD